MINSRNLFFSAVLITCLSILGWWLGAHEQERTSSDNRSSTSVTGITTPTQHAGIVAISTIPIAHADRYTELVRAASQGVADAAYHLAQGREACMDLHGKESLDQLRKNSDRSTQDKPSTSDELEKIEREKAKQRAEIDHLRDACIGDKTVSYDELDDAWARAARLGSHEAQFEYATNPRLNAMTAATDLERWRDWRDSAQGYLDAALQAGSTNAALALAAASDTKDCQIFDDIDPPCMRGSLIGINLPQDTAAAYRYYLLDQLMGDSANAEWVNSQLQKLATALTPEQVDAAQTQAQQIFARIRTGD